MSWERLLDELRRANAAAALAVGVLLALTALFILADITLRRVGSGLGGSDEIAGYVMAITASWGLGYALLEGAHVRIDLVHRRLPGAGRAALDLVAIGALAATVALVAFQCWPVLEKSLARGSRANTPLETPLWIPQALWFGGWLWFAASALVMLVAAIGLLTGGRREAFDRRFAATDETATVLAEEGERVAHPSPTPSATGRSGRGSSGSSGAAGGRASGDGRSADAAPSPPASDDAEPSDRRAPNERDGGADRERPDDGGDITDRDDRP